MHHPSHEAIAPSLQPRHRTFPSHRQLINLPLSPSLYPMFKNNRTKVQKNDKKDAHSRNRTEDLLISDTFGLRVRRCTTKPNGLLEVIASLLVHVTNPHRSSLIHPPLHIRTFPHRIYVSLTRATACQVQLCLPPTRDCPWHELPGARKAATCVTAPLHPPNKLPYHASLRGKRTEGLNSRGTHGHRAAG